jgi:hypothetical protein
VNAKPARFAADLSDDARARRYPTRQALRANTPDWPLLRAESEQSNSLRATGIATACRRIPEYPDAGIPSASGQTYITFRQFPMSRD